MEMVDGEQNPPHGGTGVTNERGRGPYVLVEDRIALLEATIASMAHDLLIISATTTANIPPSQRLEFIGKLADGAIAKAKEA